MAFNRRIRAEVGEGSIRFPARGMKGFERSSCVYISRREDTRARTHISMSPAMSPRPPYIAIIPYTISILIILEQLLENSNGVSTVRDTIFVNNRSVYFFHTEREGIEGYNTLAQIVQEKPTGLLVECPEAARPWEFVVIWHCCRFDTFTTMKFERKMIIECKRTYTTSHDMIHFKGSMHVRSQLQCKQQLEHES